MAEHGREIIDYIQKEILRSNKVSIDENTPLVSSGMIDSFSLVDILCKLEDVTNMRIPAGKVQPKDMDTVRLMLETAQRAGKPR